MSMNVFKQLMMVVTLSLSASACVSPAPEPTPSDPVSVGYGTDVEIFGRPFVLHLLDTVIEGEHHRFLQIMGDSVIISFGSSTPSQIPSVSGSTITYGGHSIEVLLNANTYRVDGTQYDLAPHGLYAFYDGRFGGRIK